MLFYGQYRLFIGWITISTGYIAIQWIGVDKRNHATRWIVIYPLDNIIHIIKNRGLALRFTTQVKYFQVLFSQTILENATANINQSFCQFLSCIKIGTSVCLALLFNNLNNKHMPLNRKRKRTCLWDVGIMFNLHNVSFSSCPLCVYNLKISTCRSLSSGTMTRQLFSNDVSPRNLQRRKN